MAGRRIRGRVAFVVICVALTLVGCAPVRHAPFPPGYTSSPDEYGQKPHGWARIADSPLSARHGATAVSIDGRFLVIGGTAAATTCKGSSCSSGNGRALRDGAAYDPDTDQWTPIAPAPIPTATADYALLDSNLYVITPGASAAHRRHFLRYDPRADSWARLPAPAARPGHLLAEPGSLVDVADATTGTGPVDYSFTPNAKSWEPESLPADPMGPSHDRRLFWADGDLVLFAQPGSASSRPSLVQTSTIWSSRGWSAPKTLPTVGTGPVLLVSGTFVFPDRGQTLGSDGKDHPVGAIDRAGGWTDLPHTDLTPMTDAGITQTLLIGGSVLDDGLLLDVTTDTYRSLPAFLGAGRNDAASAAGENLFVWGGTNRRTGQDLADGYLLYP